LRAQNRERGPRFQLTASKLAQAFQSINLQESVLLQRLRTRESQAVRSRTLPAEEGEHQVSGDVPKTVQSLGFGEPVGVGGQVFERF
jgi:hypothetical protein